MTGIGLIGFGRVGRGLFKELHLRGSVGQVVCLAELNPTGRDTRESTANLAYLLAQDSTYGPFPGRVEAKGTSLLVDGREIPVHFSAHPEQVDWAGAGARVVVEASGDLQATAEARGLLSRGVEKVLLTRSAATADATLVRGLNLESYDSAVHHLVSCSTCTANALAPVLAVIHQAYSVRRCAVTTVHPALSGDTLLDAPAAEFAAGRSGLGLRAVASEVARTTGQLLPELQGRLTAMSLRVPTTAVNALVADISLVSPPGSAAAVEALLEEAQQQKLQGVMALDHGSLGRPRPAGDFLGDPHSAVVDLNWLALSGELLRLLIWHDNEYAYCCRVVDTLETIAAQL
jgi:glyceraldehyde 3-phosphate dehydrogenase (phosphorylating)